MKNRLTVLVLISCVVMLSGCIESGSYSEPRHYIPYDDWHDPVYVNYGDDVNEDIKEVCWEFLQYMPTYMRGEVDCSDMAVYLWNKLQEKGVKTVLVVGSIDGEYTPFNECDHIWLQCRTPTGCITIEPTTPAIIYSNGYATFRTESEVDELMVTNSERFQNDFFEVYDEMYPGAPSNIRELAMEIWIQSPEVMERHREYHKYRFIEDSSKFDKYSYGFRYAKPSDLRADVGDRW